MRLRIWIYYFRHALINILSHRLIHMISMGTISISLLFFVLFILLFVNVNQWMLEWGQSLSMSVYLEDGIGAGTKKGIESKLTNLPGAEMTGFVSKDKAMLDLMEGLGPQSGLVAGLSNNPLPASFEIIFKDIGNNQVDPKK